VSGLFFFLDTSTLLSYAQAARAAEGRTDWASSLRGALGGGVWMALMATSMVWVGGAGEGTQLGLVGGVAFLVGTGAGFAARRISPVDPSQLQAALSLGLTPSDTLREVVIPGGRPGLLMWLNLPFRRTRLARPDLDRKRTKASL